MCGFVCCCDLLGLVLVCFGFCVVLCGGFVFLVCVFVVVLWWCWLWVLGVFFFFVVCGFALVSEF